MGRRAFDVLLGLMMAAALAVATALLLRDVLAIAWRVPLDPNEGWNAYHALAAIGGRPLYPHAPAMMANNYPPLSFYLIGALNNLTGDAIVAGRLVSLAAFLVIVAGLAALLRQCGASGLASPFSALVFAATLLIATDYVAMDDPQLLGHALQILGLLLIARRRPMIIGGALLMTAGLFVKHNLVALPLAVALWLIGHDRKAAVRFMLAGLAAGLAGLGILRFLGIDLSHEILSPRLFSFANFQIGVTQFLAWAVLPVAVALWLYRHYPRDSRVRFVILYAAIAIALGSFFAAGDGVDANVFFDAAIALSLGGGMAVDRFPASGRFLVALAYLVPLGILLVRDFHDSDFGYEAPFRHEAATDIAFTAGRQGPALCQDLALCYWAGKEASVDVFNMGEAFATGARSDAALVSDILRCQFSVAQLDMLGALGPDVHAALLAHYRVDHRDDNGIFLVRRACGPGLS